MQGGASIASTHPVVASLAQVCSRMQLSKLFLSRLINARADDAADGRQPSTLRHLEDYAEATQSSVLYLTLEACGVRDSQADHAASHVGKAAGLALALRATPVLAPKRRTFIPADVAARHGLSAEDIYRGERAGERAAEALADVALEVATAAKQHLDHARELASALPEPARRALLPAVSADAHLQALEAANFDLYHSALTCSQGDVRGQARMWWHRLRGTL